ncbi:MAG: hypothetical protein GKR93_17935 [Gammaproteobacteria bacterium]|nr:hypothetical protein [Gammaproteobacteria bacterium]
MKKEFDSKRIRAKDVLHFLFCLFALFMNTAAAISVSPSPSYTSVLNVTWSNATSGSSSYGNQLQKKSGSGGWAYVSTSAGAKSKYYSSSGNTTHQFKIVNIGCSWGTCWEYLVEGPVSVLTTNPSSPSTPSGPTNDANGAYTISWGVATGAVYYQVQQRISTGGWSTYNTSTSRSKAFSGNGNGIWQYRARGCAVSNYTRCSSWSGIKSVNVAIAPGVPASISISPTTSNDGAHTVSWGSSSGSVTTYRLERAIGGGSYSQIYSGTGLSQAYSGLTDGSYQYRSRACKTISSYTNCSGYRTSSAATVSTIPSTPGTPVIDDGTSSPDGAYTVSWTASTGPVTAYELEEQVNAGAWTQIQSSTALSLALSGKADGDYAYRVRACSASGCSGYTSITSVTVLLIPGVPVSLTAPASNTDGIYTVSWSAASGTVATYTLEEQFNGGSWTVVQNTSALNMNITGRGDGTYTYRVKACNASGCSASTSTISVAVLLVPSAPGQFSITALMEQFQLIVSGFLPRSRKWLDTPHSLENGQQEVRS